MSSWCHLGALPRFVGLISNVVELGESRFAKGSTNVKIDFYQKKTTAADIKAGINHQLTSWNEEGNKQPSIITFASFPTLPTGGPEGKLFAYYEDVSDQIGQQDWVISGAVKGWNELSYTHVFK